MNVRLPTHAGLDVLTKKEGELQLRPANFFIIWIVCIGIYWQTCALSLVQLQRGQPTVV